MRRFLLPGSVAAAAVALILLLAFGVARQDTSSSLDAEVASGHLPPAPDAALSLPRLGGSGRISLAAMRGKVVLLNVFASWCDPCAAEAPVLEQAEHTLAAHGGTVLGVTYLDNAGDSAAFARRFHITYPVMRDVDGSFVRSFGTTGVPETFVIDRRGRIAAIRRFQIDQRWLAQTLPAILAGRA